jgi:hypothetical protein
MGSSDFLGGLLKKDIYETERVDFAFNSFGIGAFLFNCFPYKE